MMRGAVRLILSDICMMLLQLNKFVFIDIFFNIIR